jgi:HEAT repeat protein
VGFCFGLPPFIFYLLPTVFYHKRGICNTAYVLSQICDPEFQRVSIPAMVEAFSRLGFFSSNKLVDALVEVGNPAVEWLIIGLRSKKPNVRRGCIAALGRLQTPAAIEPLIATLREGDPRYFIATVGALGQFDDQRCRSAIARSLEVIEPKIQVLAGAQTWTKAFSKTDHADESLTLFLVENAARDRPKHVRHFAILALGAYGHPAALPTLERIARDSGDPLRSLALKSLAKLDSPEVVESLLEIAEKTPDLGPKGDAVIAIGAIVSKSAVNALLPLLNHPYWWIRDAALKSLGRLRQPSSVPAILDHLVALQPDSGREVADTLGRIGSPETFEGLVTLCRDPREPVRERALFMLDHVFPDRSGPLFVDLLRDPSYPDRPALLELLVAAPPAGDEFRQVLLGLRHDLDQQVAAAAIAAHNRLDKGLEQRLKQLGVALGGTRVGNLANRIVEWSGWPDYQRAVREIELTTDSDSGFSTGIKVLELANRDPEIGLTLRRISRIFAAAFFVGLFMIGALPVLLWRPMSGLGKLAMAYWPWALGIGAAAGASYMPGLRQLRRVRRFGVVVGFLRASLIFLPLALTIRYGPGGIMAGSSLLSEGILWGGEQLWRFKLWSGTLVIAAVLLTALGARGPQPLRALRVLFMFGAGLVAIIGLFSLALLYWFATIGLIVLAFFAAVLISRRVTRASRKARIRSLQSAYAVAAPEQLPLALEMGAHLAEGEPSALPFKIGRSEP